jgi:hemerythrin-like domain-containing protein
MAVTDLLRKQHADLATVIGQIDATLNPARLAQGANDAQRLLAGLLGKLSMHFAMEDNVLYPSLTKHTDATVRDTGKRFFAEMAGVKPMLEALGKKWTATEITKKPADFCAETKKVFALLSDRLKRENTELYPLLERT